MQTERSKQRLQVNNMHEHADWNQNLLKPWNEKKTTIFQQNCRRRSSCKKLHLSGFKSLHDWAQFSRCIRPALRNQFWPGKCLCYILSENFNPLRFWSFWLFLAGCQKCICCQWRPTTTCPTQIFLDRSSQQKVLKYWRAFLIIGGYKHNKKFDVLEGKSLTSLKIRMQMRWRKKITNVWNIW